jgi:hypothetical protein
MIDEPASLLLAVLKFADVDVACFAVKLPAFSTLAILLPRSFIDCALERDDFAETFPDELPVLSEVNVSIAVQKLADCWEPAIYELALEDQVFSIQQKHTKTLKLIIDKRTAVNVAASHDHLSILSHVVLPETYELRSIIPGHHTESLSFARLEVSLVSRFLVLSAVNAWQALGKFQRPFAACSPIFEMALKRISICEDNPSKTVKSAILD